MHWPAAVLGKAGRRLLLFSYQPGISSPLCFNILCPPTLNINPPTCPEKHSRPCNSLGISWGFLSISPTRAVLVRVRGAARP